MSSFVFEIGVEEMPARFVPKLAKEIQGSLEKLLAEAMVDMGEVQTSATPRRIVAHVSDIALTQRSLEEEVTGPPVKIAFDADGKLTKAGAGFAKTQGVDETDLYTVSSAKGEYLACKVGRGGGATLDVLPGVCIKSVESLNFPKKMRWGSREFAFGRPIRWFLALLDEQVVEFELAEMASGRLSWGHRIMGPGPFEMRSATDYLERIEQEGSVLANPTLRADLILARGQELAAALGGTVVWKDSLLEEVTNLVEYPVPILGSFAPLYLELPREVLLTSMEKHQKSFGVEGPDGKLLPTFLTTLNIEPQDVELVRKGWERVLRARLEDARFFWEADNRANFEQWQQKLESVVFIGPIGTVADKCRRLEKLCTHIAMTAMPDLSKAKVAEFAKAGLLSKCDLVSEMVIEFDSLQGIMGGIYAEKKGLGTEVSQALYEQYLPAGPDSPVPASLAGAVLSMADKADTLVGCFGLKMIPTGANDPYALRRAVLGIIRIALDHGLRLSLTELVSQAQAGYPDKVQWKVPPTEAHAKIMDFFAGRLRAFFTGQGVSTKVADAAIGAGFDDLSGLKGRIEALDAFAREDDFEQAVLTFKRASNIIRKQGDEVGDGLTGEYDLTIMDEVAEKGLAEKLRQTAPRFDELWKADEFAGLLGLLRELRPSVDEFFDNVMVMCEDEGMRLNRLNLLKALVDRLGKLADFGALQV
ncbi:MAG: glycine--tRNA ligase subunit beta [Proteobacteria bacterium]|nr:glycine--tRNA ligase subunit beta [Pseudomonadota bacterium]MBU1610235.1 glycine--tRNA ligase subunit beta [Pseudomonadota bacterium]